MHKSRMETKVKETTQPQKLSISVVIPLYNKENHIVETLMSIEQQTIHPMEVVIVDDGSTDRSSEIVDTYIFDHPELDFKIRLIHQLNSGVSVARNRGIQAAKGDYIAFLDADDQWLPHFLEEVTYLIREYKTAEVFATSYQLSYTHDVYQMPKIAQRKLIQQPGLMTNYFEICGNGNLPFMMSSIVFKASTFERIGNFPEGETMGEDQDLFSRAALNCDIAYSPKALLLYAMESDNKACNQNIPDQECPFSQRLYQQLSPNELSKQLYDEITKYTAAHLLHLAKLNLQAGNLNAARSLLNDPRCIRIPSKKLVNELRFTIKWFTLKWLNTSTQILNKNYQKTTD